MTMTTTRLLRWTLVPGSAGLLCAALGGCGDADVIDHGSGGSGGEGGVAVPAECESMNWRAATPDAVICPGAPGCSCALPQACCAWSAAVADGRCVEVSQCAQQVLVCDGPEDCAGTDICCATPQGADCRDPLQCTGSDKYVLCRATSDCPHATDECLPGRPPLLGYCE